jgi:hypothetical protein
LQEGRNPFAIEKYPVLSNHRHHAVNHGQLRQT